MAAPNSESLARMRDFARRLVDPARARVAIEPEKPLRGYWFGGGKLALGPDGRLYLTGRYRNAGDSRTGLDLGDRGRELAVFSTTLPLAAPDRPIEWTKHAALEKENVAPDGMEVLSIEGSAMRFTDRGVELYVSSEKAASYPEPVGAFRKQGTGVWTIERMEAPTVEGLSTAKAVTILASDDPATLHLKDPFLSRAPDGTARLFFCHHPYNWSSSGTGWVALDASGLPAGAPSFDCWSRGPAWDVAITRGTCALALPASLAPAGCGLAFYDGGECLRNLDEHERSVRRPRGYSCEELGGLGWFDGDEPARMRRFSTLFPEFVSPDGTGCVRYVDAMVADGWCIATWQQSRPDGSQPLMINALRLP